MSYGAHNYLVFWITKLVDPGLWTVVLVWPRDKNREKDANQSL